MLEYVGAAVNAAAFAWAAWRLWRERRESAKWRQRCESAPCELCDAPRDRAHARTCPLSKWATVSRLARECARWKQLAAEGERARIRLELELKRRDGAFARETPPFGDVRHQGIGRGRV